MKNLVAWSCSRTAEIQREVSEWEVQVTDSDRWSFIQQQLSEGAFKKQGLGDSKGEELAFNRKRPPSEVGSERGGNLLMR